MSKSRWIWAVGFWGVVLGACAVSPAVRRDEARLVPPGEGRKLDVLGESITVKVGPGQTGGDYAVIEEQTPPGGGPPPHIHDREDEVFYVLAGEVEFMVGGKTIAGKPGSLGFIPRGTAHTFKNVGAAPCKVLVFISPGGFVGFFEEIDARSKAGNLPKEEVVKIAQRYGMTVLPPPSAPK